MSDDDNPTQRCRVIATEAAPVWATQFIANMCGEMRAEIRQMRDEIASMNLNNNQAPTHKTYTTAQTTEA